MNINDLPHYQKRERAAPVRREIPAVKYGNSLTGPETITGRLREIVVDTVDRGYVRCWDDPMGRAHYFNSFTLAEALLAAGTHKPVSVTTEKLRGRWTITNVKEAA